MATTTKTIEFKLYQTDDGVSVCKLSQKEKCPFLGVRKFGTVYVCMVSGDDLYDGSGWIEPMEEASCFLRKTNSLA